jgi:hypothetical protein
MSNEPSEWTENEVAAAHTLLRNDAFAVVMGNEMLSRIRDLRRQLEECDPEEVAVLQAELRTLRQWAARPYLVAHKTRPSLKEDL